MFLTSFSAGNVNGYKTSWYIGLAYALGSLGIILICVTLILSAAILCARNKYLAIGSVFFGVILLVVMIGSVVLILLARYATNLFVDTQITASALNTVVRMMV